MAKCNQCGGDNYNNDTGYCQFCLTQLTPEQAEATAIKNDQTSPSQQYNSTKLTPSDRQPNSSIAVETKKMTYSAEDDGNIDSGTNEKDPDEESEQTGLETDPMFEIKEVDFGDLSVPGLISPVEKFEGTYKHEESLMAGDSHKEEPESIENELNLFRDDEIQIAMENTEAGPALTLAEKSEFQSAPEILPQELPEDFNSEYKSPKIPEITEDELLSNDDEPTTVTQKIAIPKDEAPIFQTSDETRQLPGHDKDTDMVSPIDRLSDSDFPKKDREMPGFMSIDSQDDKPEFERKYDKPQSFDTIDTIKPVKSHGIAFLSAGKISLAGGYKPAIGETITIDDKVFTLKEKPGLKIPFYAKIGGGIVLFLILIMAIFSLGPSEKGQIAGTLTNPMTGKAVSGAIISIKELDKTTRTSQAGLFFFDEISPGSYTVELQDDGVGIISEQLTVLENRTSVAALSLPGNESSAVNPAKSKNGNAGQIEISRELKPGFMKLKLSPTKAKVYYDGEYIGQGGQTFKVAAGNHKVTVKYDGYKSENKSVDIPEDQVKSYTITLKKLSGTDKPEKKTDLEIAQELEDQGKYSDALKNYYKILKKDDKNLEAILGQARCLKAGGDTDNSLTAFLSALSISDEQGDIEIQLEALNGVLDINPNYLTALYKRGSIFLNQGEYYRAAQDFAKVIEIDRRHLNAFYKLGESYYKAGNYPAAIESYEKIQELNFADATPFAYIAKSYMKLDDKKNMKKYYQKFEKDADISTKNKFRSDLEWQQVRMMAE